MIIDKEDIENILYLVPQNLEPLKQLAPQEVVRLAEIIFNSMTEMEAKGFDFSQDFESWSEALKNKINTEINEASVFFGDSRLAQKIDLLATLKTFFTLSRVIF